MCYNLCMDAKRKYLIHTTTDYIMSTVMSTVECLNYEDVCRMNIDITNALLRGKVTVDNSNLIQLFSLQVDDSTEITGNLVKIPKDELFEQNLLPGDRLYLKQLVEGKSNIDLVIFYKDGKLLTAYDNVKIPFIKAFFLHLRTINRHRRLVRRNCFKVGLYFQGLTHDLSKYSPSEFFVGVKYYQGVRSPNVAERNNRGYSAAWMHHKGRNKHHHEYWTDYNMQTGELLGFVEMPKKYFIESIMDRIAACKVYRGKTYTDSAPLDYLLTRDSESHMNPTNRSEMIRILTMLKERGEAETFRYIKHEYLK